MNVSCQNYYFTRTLWPTFGLVVLPNIVPNIIFSLFVSETSAGVKHRTDTVSSIEVNNTSPCEDGITSYSESSVASTFGSVTVNKLSHRKSGTSQSPSELSADSKCMSVISNRKPPRETESSPLLRLSGSKFQSITVAGKQLYDAGFTPHRESSARSYNSSPYEGKTISKFRF